MLRLEELNFMEFSAEMLSSNFSYGSEMELFEYVRMYSACIQHVVAYMRDLHLNLLKNKKYLIAEFHYK